MQVQDRQKLQVLLEKEIEAQGIHIGWDSIGKLAKEIKISKTKYARYKECKVAILPEGNVLICKIDGCFNVMQRDDLCITHLKDIGKRTNRYCISEEICSTQATFGNENGPTLFCKKHSSTEMIDIKNRKCKEPGCKKQPGFGLSGEQAQWCFDHKKDDSKDIHHKICKEKGCEKRAAYGDLNDKVQYCIDHKLESNLRLDKGLCAEIGCRTQAIFGYKDEKLRYCKVHSKSDMNDLLNKKCLYPNCNTRPIYGNPGGKKLYCVDHKEPQMIDLYNKQCLNEACEKQASFAFPGDKSVYCDEHKLSGMCNVRSKRCIHQDCDIIATFGFPDKKAIYCKIHKIEGTLDVKHPKCISPGCKIRPTHGYLYSNVSNHCSEHSTFNEFCESKRYPLCKIVECGDVAKFLSKENYNILLPIHCNEHKISTDIELVEKECAQCLIIVNIPADKEICAQCGNYRYKFSTEKEKRVKDYLKNNDINFIHNRVIHEQGSLYRPDFLIDTKFGKLIVECDEFQHSGYNDFDEINRMKVIYQDVQLIKPESEVLFIRYNPDSYKGVQLNTTERLSYLLELVNYFIDIPKLNTKLGALYLFYTGYDDNPQIQHIAL